MINPSFSRKKRGFLFYLFSFLAALSLLLIIILIILIIKLKNVEGDYVKFRAEGLSLSEAAPSGLSYLKKYLHKSFEAEEGFIEFFREQAKAISQIREREREYLLYEERVDSSLRLSFVGDIMWHRDNWGSIYGSDVRRRLLQSDLLFGNLESPIDTLSKVPTLLPDYVRYNSSPMLIDPFKRENGEPLFSALSVANNHLLDMGEDGLRRTIEFLKSRGIKYSGATFANNKKYSILSKNSFKIGFYAAGWGLNNPALLNNSSFEYELIKGVAPLNKEAIALNSIKEVIKEMKAEGVDAVILLLHWGFEYELYPDQSIIEAARELAIAGADFIIGSHPHVIQPSEIVLLNGYDFSHIECEENEYSTFYKVNDSLGQPRKALITYSTGNFITAMYTPLCRLGVIVGVELFRDESNQRVDWWLEDPYFVYNRDKSSTGERALMQYASFIDSLRNKKPREALKIEKELSVVFENYL